MKRTHSFLLSFCFVLLFGIVLLLPMCISKCGAPGASFLKSRIDPKNLKSSTFTETLDNYRNLNLQRLKNYVYMNYAKESIFSDSQFKEFIEDLHKNLYGNTHSESPSASLSNEEVIKARTYLLNYFGITKLTDYIVIFTYSYAQALKLVAESYNFNNNSIFYYSTSSNNNILGLRNFAKQKGAKVKFLNISRGDIPNDFVNNTNHMICFPLVDEFTGEVLNTIKMKQFTSITKNMGYIATMVDASTYLQNHKIDLKDTPFSAMAISFEKMFGFPKMGAAIVSGDMILKMTKPYFGGGTLVFALPNENYEKLRLKPAEKFEDGSLPFLSIASLKYGFKMLDELGFDDSSAYQQNMGQRLYEGIKSITYKTGEKGTIVYSPKTTETIVTFNVLDKSGSIISPSEIAASAAKSNITMSYGCLSTPGTCASFTGKTGAVRASVGWGTTMDDVDKVVQFVKTCLKEE